MLDPRKVISPERIHKVRSHVLEHSGEGYIGAVTLVVDHNAIVFLCFFIGLCCVYIFAALAE